VISVYMITAPAWPATRLHLPESQWAFNVREKLGQMGYGVFYVGPEPEVDTRDAAELARRDALLELTGLLQKGAKIPYTLANLGQWPEPDTCTDRLL